MLNANKNQVKKKVTGLKARLAVRVGEGNMILILL